MNKRIVRKTAIAAYYKSKDVAVILFWCAMALGIIHIVMTVLKGSV